MKSFKELNEHHDTSGESWPDELLGMSVDELLDRLRNIDQEAYDELESIISRRMDDILGNAAGGDNEKELAEIEARLKSGDLSGDTRKFLMQKAIELKGDKPKDLDNFRFDG